VLPTLGRRGGGWVAAQFALLLLIAVVGLLGINGWPEDLRGPMRLAGVLLGLVGVVFAATAVVGLGSALTPTPAPLEREVLRTTGAYAVVRHPIYGALILTAVGFSLATDPAALAVTAVLAVVLDLKRRVEERFLEVAYPEYDGYRRRVRRALVPYVW
jgi:protein-S-isoprenylcysteine O-methyltransferase Ste14